MLLKEVCFLALVLLLTADFGFAETNETLVSPSSNSSLQDQISRAAKSGAKYIAFLSPLPFFEAWHECESYGLKLAVVTSEADTNEIRVALSKVHHEEGWQFWMAGFDLGKSRMFRWITNGKQITLPNFYLNWALGEPNNYGGNEHCMTVYQDSGKWNDRDCGITHGFVCQLGESFC